jgi:hypothetical protein
VIKLIFRFGLYCFLVLSLKSYGAQTDLLVNIELEPQIVKKISTMKLTRLLLPVPQKLISNDATLQLIAGIEKIKAKFSIVNVWSTIQKDDIKKANKVRNAHYIRLLLIEVEQQDLPSKQITLYWRNHQKNRLTNGVDLNHSDVSLIFPTQNWLAQSLLLHPEYNQDDHDWYVEPQKKYAYYITNQELLSQRGYPPTRAAQWLYDRPQTVFQLFIMSGEQQWLTKGKKLSSFYQQHIDEEGLFTLKNRFDAKYLMPKGLLYDFLLSGNSQAKSALKKIYQASLAWDEKYSLKRGFWTERNQAAALNTAISYWEASNDEAALVRINNIIDATVEMTFNPQGAWLLRGCPQHSFKSHEGWGDNSPACSPWMMALLGDALWRFYQLTNDKRAAALIDAFGDFILNHGLFYGNKRVKNIVIPKYIVSIENPEQEELNQWSDPQHACDVAGLLGKSVYIKNKSGNDSFLVQSLFSAFVEQCQQSYVRLKKEQNKKQNKPYWSLKPPRRFAWMYSTTSDLPWLNNLINEQY